MTIEVKVPSPGESISEVQIASWLVNNGDFVEKDMEVAELESDKATLPLIAEDSGSIEILAKEGETVEVGSVVCKIDTSAEAPEKNDAEKSDGAEKESTEEDKKQKSKDKKAQKSDGETKNTSKEKTKSVESEKYNDVKVSPVARKIMDNNNLNVDDIINGLKRIGKKEVEAVLNTPDNKTDKTIDWENEDNFSRAKGSTSMSSLRKKLSERLVAVKNETAMLTTFNEVDMSGIMDMRKAYQKTFIEKYGYKVGLMSFFIKAVAEALKLFPAINSMLDGYKVISHDYADVGIAVQTPKGLMVPVIRNAESLSLAQIEEKIKEYAEKGKANRITLDDMTGGTFTITNGGTFGSLLSTPIINPPQSAILGMHNIIDRPVAIDRQVVIRPMMYTALSYDHRLIDGKTSVSFLVKVKELCENPVSMMFGNKKPEEILLGI